MSESSTKLHLNDIVDEVLYRRPSADADQLYKAYIYSAKVHQGQLRKSGEPYLTHPMEVAYILAKMGMDVATVAAGFLHDTIEDTWATREDLENNFGGEVLKLVDGVTKLSQFDTQSKSKRKIESFRKLILASIEDPRVIVIKLADRVHNMRTIGAMRKDKKLRIAEETLSIYGPIAHRLGMLSVSNELEDRAFEIVQPEVFDEIRTKRDALIKQRSNTNEKIVANLSEILAQQEIPSSVTGRIKSIHSIAMKMERDKLDFESVLDIFAFRIIVDDVATCYRVLGVVHAMWQPVRGSFKDYIAVPKKNGYQSLHTTVVGEEGGLIEVQIRTREMHRFSELGIAAHWAYKEGALNEEEQLAYYQVARQMLDVTSGTHKPDSFFKKVREELKAGHIFALTPTGDTIELPEASTVLDFAFRIHSDVGLKCSGGMVNGEWVPMHHSLQNGDVVSVQTKSSVMPTREWINFAKTQSARTKIRSYLKDIETFESLRQGRKLFASSLKSVFGRGTTWKPERVDDFARSIGLKDSAQMYESLGSGKILPTEVKDKLLAEKGESPTFSQVAEGLRDIFRSSKKDIPEIIVDGEEEYMLRVAKCCRPLVGDEIIGFVTRGNGISIHRSSCDAIANRDQSRIISAEWNSAISQESEQAVRVRVLMDNSKGSLATISQIMAKSGANITHTSVSSTDHGAEGLFVLLVRDRAQLDRIFASLKKSKVVKHVKRVS